MANTAICTFRLFLYQVEKYTILVTEDHRYLFARRKRYTVYLFLQKGSYISIMFSILFSMFQVGSLINNHIITPMIDTEKGVPASRINHTYHPGRW